MISNLLLEDIFEPSPTTGEYEMGANDAVYITNSWFTDLRSFPEDWAWTTKVPSSWCFVTHERVAFKIEMFMVWSNDSSITLHYDDGPTTLLNWPCVSALQTYSR